MNNTPIARSQVTGLVLAGGRGSRMGGVDKGLLLHRGQALARHAAERLAPQVGALLINANRHHAAYAAFGWPVVPDANDDAAGTAGSGGAGSFAGPLAGMLAGLRHCTTPYLATVACDTPNFPPDLVQRLARGLCDSGAAIAMAASTHAGAGAGAGAAVGRRMLQPVFCLLHMSVRDSLAAALRSGQHKVQAWAAAQGCVQVLFDNVDAGTDAFANANTPQELQALQPPASPTQL